MLWFSNFTRQDVLPFFFSYQKYIIISSEFGCTVDAFTSNTTADHWTLTHEPLRRTVRNYWTGRSISNHVRYYNNIILRVGYSWPSELVGSAWGHGHWFEPGRRWFRCFPDGTVVTTTPKPTVSNTSANSTRWRTECTGEIIYPIENVSLKNNKNKTDIAPFIGATVLRCFHGPRDVMRKVYTATGVDNRGDRHLRPGD